MKGRNIIMFIFLAALIICPLYWVFVCLNNSRFLLAGDNITTTLFKDGTYEGRSFKFPGPMKVAVTIKNGKITDIKILKHLAPKKYKDIMGILINRIIERQSAQIDGITGATISSNALKKAVGDALLKTAFGKDS